MRSEASGPRGGPAAANGASAATPSVRNRRASIRDRRTPSQTWLTSRTPPAPGRPGVYFVPNDSAPLVQVDDEKLARFVQMGFDVDKVSESLQKFDNNEQQAMEDLLGCV